MPTAVLLIPIVSTLLGGVLAVRFRQHLTLLTAIGAGLLLGAAFLDLLPEAIWIGLRSGIAISSVLGWALLAFLLFYGLDTGLRSLERSLKNRFVSDRLFRRTGAAMLIFHSFRDGMAIGAAFSASHVAGYAVACGIAAHDLGDGMNTVILTTRGEKPLWSDWAFLAADALAPLLGGVLTMWWSLSAKGSVIVLVLAAGFFLEMATGDFLPEVRRGEGPRRFLVPAVLGGVFVIYLANFLLARFGH